MNVGKKNHDAKINYMYTNAKNLIAMLEPICESVNMMRPRYDDYDTSDERPKLILRGVGYAKTQYYTRCEPLIIFRGATPSSHGDKLNVVTRSHPKVFLRGANVSKKPSAKMTSSSTTSTLTYDLVNQL